MTRAAATLARMLALGAMCVTALACGDDGALSPDGARAFAQARARWADKGGPDYTVESRIVCFCPPHLAQWTRLTVRGGVVVAADPVETRPDGFEPSLQGWLTVEELFDLIANPSSVVTRVEVAFDPVFGYPLEANTTCAPNIADCGSTREMRNLRIP